MQTAPEPLTVLVTGARTGLGRHLAEDWLRRGARTIGCSRGATDLRHERYTHFTADVAEEHGVVRMFAEIRRAFGRLDVLVNNAGILAVQAALLTPAATAAAVMRTNFLGTFLCSREAAILMKKTRFGRIVNISSMSVPHAVAGSALYGASKAAVEHFSRAFAKEVAGYGITVNAVGLPPVEDTGMLATLPPPALADALDHTVLKRSVTPAEAAHAVAFFASPDSGAITGQTLHLGGC